MTIKKLEIIDALEFTHPVHNDERGFFREWFKSSLFAEVNFQFDIRQANISKSKKNVIRGIHYSMSSEGQAKLVTAVVGHITDIIVDLRIGSPTYLKVAEVELIDNKGNVLFVPSGVGHGFIVRSEVAHVSYLTSTEYSPDDEKSICPTDPQLEINWKIPVNEFAVISESDLLSYTFAQVQSQNNLPLYQGKK